MNLTNGLIRVFISVFMLTISTASLGQSELVEWINKNAHELSTDSAATDQDLHFLPQILKSKTVVGLGEASHGTHEFFFQKRRITQYLVTHEQYRLVALEFAQAYIEPIDIYIQTGKGDLKSMVKEMVLYNSEEIYKLFEWLKIFNASRPHKDRVKIIGFDDPQFWRDPLYRDENMALKFINYQSKESQKSILWSHNIHLAKDITMANYKAMGYYIKKHFADGYYVFAFDTFRGSVRVLDNDGNFELRDFANKEDSFAALFSKSKLSSFLIDFNTERNPLIGVQNYITNIYSDWREPRTLPMIPGIDFDGLIFIRNTTFSKIIK